MERNDFNYAYILLLKLYDIEMLPDDFEEVGMVAWNLIGNKECKMYRYSTSLKCSDLSVLLPCNCVLIEAVTGGHEDYQSTSNIYAGELPGSYNTETYIEANKKGTDRLYIPGYFIHYELIGDTLYFLEHHDLVNILYYGIILNDEGLPYLNEKEALAIATFCAWRLKFKDALSTNNPNIFTIALLLLKEWITRCADARAPMYLNLNDMDEIANVKSSWDRKRHNFSFKPVVK